MIPERVLSIIGQTSPVRVFEVEKGAIRRFADAVDDRNPLYWDDDYARKSRYCGIIAPPGFFGWPVTWERGAAIVYEGPLDTHRVMREFGFGISYDGGIEYEFFKPVRAGDILHVVDRIKDMIEREGKSGTLTLVTTEITYTNSTDAVVAIARWIVVYQRG